MACIVNPADCRLPDYAGLDAIFEYTNGDGGCVRTNCGQAASATLLTFHGKLPPDAEQACQVMAEIERHHPPDNMGGAFGTSRRRVERICRSFGLHLHEIEGEEALRRQLGNRNPVVVMLGVSAGRFWKFDLPGGHWMVAYGYDRDQVYLTNYGWMTWPQFRAGWDGLVPRLIGMRRRGLVAVSPALEL